MSKLEESVNEILGIESKEPKGPKEFKPLVPRKENIESPDLDNDYTYSRENYYNLIERGQEAVQGILDVAREGQSPRAYEVAGQLIKNVGDITDKLLDLQKKVKDIDDDKPKGPTTVNNALFVGSTAELAKLLKQQSQETKE